MTLPIRLTTVAVLLATPTLAALPEPAPLPPPIAAPADKPYPGEIFLNVDATDLDHHVFRVHETVPVTPGPLTLLYPKFIPGNHGPTGPLDTLAGLVMKLQGQRIPWLRDTVNMYAFHVTIPPGATKLDIYFQYLSPPEQREGRVVMTPNMLDVQWNPELLYPAGSYARDIIFHPALLLPDGWQFGTALETEAQQGPHTVFKPVPLETLMDSPLYAGRYFSRIDLDPGANVPVHLDIVADRPQDLAIKPADLTAHRNLVKQAYLNYGSRHYNHYDFLFSLSDDMGGEGLEHQRSSENGVDENYFTDAEKSLPDRDLLPHEYTHSWNGKFRRPADLYSPDYNIVPERDSLLWVYEGQTEYWGQILAARAGILTAAQVRDNIALFAADLAATPGRGWRNLQDTTNDPILSMRRPQAWRSYQRDEDYYIEGLMIWLDADTLIRERSNNTKSLSDFARAFFGVQDGSWTTLTYNFNDVATTLNSIQPYDWTQFLRNRLNGHATTPPLDGITRGGYRLTYTDEKSPMEKAAEADRKTSDFSFSLGLALGEENNVQSVIWDSPAFQAGLAKGVKLLAVNGLAVESGEDLATAITEAKTTTTPLELLIREGKHFKTVKIDYHGGLRYPHLERIPNTPARLDDILAPLK